MPRATGADPSGHGDLPVKYAVVIPDGMADHPLERLDGRTPVEAAATPHLDRVALGGRLGLVCHTPDGLPPGSDVAILSLLGYDPARYYTGRAPLEAASRGLDLAPGEMVFRCNLVTTDGDTLADHSAGNIPSAEAAVLIDLLNEHLATDAIRFHAGVGYRHLMVYRGGPTDVECTPPHDILDRPFARHLPRGKGADTLIGLMQRSREILAETDINDVRIDLGENPATMIWLWGGGTKPALPAFARRFGKSGAVVAAVDLVRGIGLSIGLTVVHVEGATGYLNTDYAAKGQGAIDALECHDVAIVHIEAPDEAGHSGDIQAKVDAIEAIDKHITGPILSYLETCGDHRLLVLPDHPTPIDLRTHVHEAVPFACCGTGIDEPSGRLYSEANAAETGLVVDPGHELMGRFLGEFSGT